MKKRHAVRLLASLLLCGLAQPAAAADTLDELLEQTRNARALEARAIEAREQEFLANRDQQKELLAQAKALHDELEAIYNPHVDFARVYALANSHALRLFKEN